MGSTRNTNKHKATKSKQTLDRLPRSKRLDKGMPKVKGTAVCPSCKAVFSEKYWSADSEKFEQFSKESDVAQVNCPGCQKASQGIYDGEVVLESPFLSKDHAATMKLIEHTEDKAWHDNPLSKIVEIEENGDRMRILTTTCWLANRLGKAFQKAYSGKLEIKPLSREKFVRVYWSRED